MSFEDNYWIGDDWGVNDENYTIKFNEFKYETEKAYLLRIGKKEYWFPKSQVEIDEDEKEIIVPLWLIEELDLEDLVDFD